MTLAQSRPWMIGAVVLLGIALIAVVAVAQWRSHQRRDASEAAYWRVDGPPCPQLSAEVFRAARLRAPRQFDYGGSRAGDLRYGVTRFGRFAGHVSCNQVPNGLHTRTICQFTSPAALSVRTGRGEVFYAPGTGRPASVIIDRDVPRCVLASHFTL